MLYKMKIKKYLKNYIDNLKNYTLLRGLETMTKVHHELINDTSDINNISHHLINKSFRSKKLRSMPTKTFNII